MPIPVTEYNRIVTEWMRDHWESNPRCPMCRTAAGWTLLATGELPLRQDIEDTPQSKAVPVVPLVCRNCGYVICLSAVTLGLIASVPDAPEPSPGSAR